MNAPKLRFQEFQDEWQKKKLRAIFKISAGGDIGNENVSAIKTEKFKYPIYANAEKDKGFYGYSDIYKIEENVITVAGRGVNFGIAHARDHKFYPIVRLLVLKPKNIENIYFFEYQLNRLNLFKESTGVPQLTAPQISTYEVFYPEIPEQNRIASFFMQLDKKITELKQKKSLLEQYKKGIMQKLFSQELRFKDENGKDFPEWEENKLGNISKITTGSSNREDSILDGEYTFFDRSQDIRTSNRFLFDAEAIIVPGEGQEFIPKYFKGKFDLHQRTYAIMDFVNINGVFLFYSISFNTKHLNSHAVGSTVKSLRLPMFESMPINLPCLSEQTKIANFLSSLDEKINRTENQIQKTQEWKKGLLQKMFC
jgi:type I restriction enzyme S subunit